MVEPVIPPTLSISTYPWPTIDARDLLRRLDEAENRLMEMARANRDPADVEPELSDDLKQIVDDGMAKAGLAPGKMDYNDQCDIVFGRIFRLLNENPEACKVTDAGELIALGLDVSGLGLSGEQMTMAFSHAVESIRRMSGYMPATAIVDELDAILSEAGIDPRSTVEAMKSGDLVGRVQRLVASRARAIEQWAAANEGAETDKAADPAPATTEPPA